MTNVLNPTIALVGGGFTPDGGAAVDSRQQVDNDDASDVMRKSLARSWLWWTTVSTLVLPILEARGDAAYALVLGERSVTELKSDGSVRRAALRALLPGGTGNVTRRRVADSDAEIAERLANQVHRGVSDGIRASRIEYAVGSPRAARWRFSTPRSKEPEGADELALPALIVDTSSGLYGERPSSRHLRYSIFEKRLSSTTDSVLVLPHTHRMEVAVEDYLDWARSGRPEQKTANAFPDDSVWDLDVPPDPIEFAQMVPVEADFKVTGLAHDWAWQSPADLEAARELLAARFDLKISIWDLVNNAVLRNSILDASPLPPPPTKAAKISRGASTRATAAVQTKVDEQMRLRNIYSHSEPLSKLGWVRSNVEPYSFLLLPLGPEIALGQRPRPVAWLALSMTRHQAQVIARAPMGVRGLGVSDYVSQHLAEFTEISDSDVSVKGAIAVLWTAKGGWADDDVDWSQRFVELANKSGRWSNALTPGVSQLYKALGRFVTHPQPLHSETSQDVKLERPSLWGLLRRSKRERT